MRKFLLWAAAITFSFATFLASCATQPQADSQAPAASSHNNGDHQNDALTAMPGLRGASGTSFSQ